VTLRDTICRTLPRMKAAKLWDRKPREGEADDRSFSAETDYFVLRQMHDHRTSCFHWIGDLLGRAGTRGAFCEDGCGVAPVTAWLRPRFPDWRFTLVDLAVPTLEFARWRFPSASNVETLEPGFGRGLPPRQDYDVIACPEVLEHVINPPDVVRHLAEHLKPGGRLVLNFSNDRGRENLVESAAQRDAAVADLDAHVIAEGRLGGHELYAQYRKP
jgi:SAM-dependent methyltransferase